MSERDFGARLFLGAVEGTRLSSEEIAFLERYRPSGVTLFSRNLSENPEQIKLLTQDIRNRLHGERTILAIDQEGGRVSRLRALEEFPDLGPAMDLANRNSDEAALAEIRDYGEAVGRALTQLGINVNFAPVCDVLTNAQNAAIGDRAFGSEPEVVAKRAGAYLEGLQQGGVHGCLKHFPGQGDADFDTHETGTTITASLEQLKRRELLPFRELLARVPMVMISHAVFPSLDPDRPASLSRAIMHQLLGTEMGFQGVVVSDDMNMKAIDQNDGAWLRALRSAAVAGCHLLLICRGLERQVRAMEYFEDICRSEDRDFLQAVSEAGRRIHRIGLGPG